MNSAALHHAQDESLNLERASAPVRSGSLLVSITTICFIFGMFLALQLRAQQSLLKMRAANPAIPQVAQLEMDSLHHQLASAQKSAVEVQVKNNALIQKMAGYTASSTQAQQKVKSEIQQLQLVAGLTKVVGPGITIRMTDNPQAAASGGGGPFLPGIVHDFDLLQVVNELRSAKAEAIAIRGADAGLIRVTGYTPIRCVGPVIYVSGEPVAAPFRIEAIGSPESLASALKMPDGIVDKLSALFPVKVTESSQLNLPAVESPPTMHVAKVG